jgi:hypothetical protein
MEKLSQRMNIQQERKAMISEAIVENSEYLEKENRWDYAIGLATIEGGKPSDFFLELVEREDCQLPVIIFL